MTNHKQKIRLTPEQETLLITLYSKALGCPDSLFADEKSREILEQIDYDFSLLKVPVGTRLTVCIRAKKIDDYVIDSGRARDSFGMWSRYPLYPS